MYYDTSFFQNIEFKSKNWSLPSNPYLSLSARTLLYHLTKIGAGSNVILGHQSTNTLSHTSDSSIQSSDIKQVCGQFPGMVSYDIGWLELGHNRTWLEGPVDRLISAIQYSRKLGLPICLSWHTRNPIDLLYDQKNRTAAGKVKYFENTVSKILNNSIIREKFLGFLDILADFFKRLVDESGDEIPILFRPFHESSGNWFWWGKNQCSSEEYIELYRLTHTYISKEKKIDQLLWVYNTDKVFSLDDFLLRYPGDDYIDLLSIDFYDSPKYSLQTFKEKLKQALDVLRSGSKQLNKPCFIAEGGRKNYNEDEYFTNRCISYFSEGIFAFNFWANSPKNYYVSFPKDPLKGNFLEMINQDYILLENKINKLNLYK